MALTEPEAATLIEILTEKPDTTDSRQKRYVARRKPKAK